MSDAQQAAMEGRAAWAELAAGSRWVVRRHTGETQTSQDGFHVVGIFESVYDGPARLQTYEGYEQSAGAPSGSSAVVQRSTLQVPVGSFASQPGDVATCVSSFDPLLVGRSMRIAQAYPVKEHATSYRMFVDENIGEDVPALVDP